LATVERLYAVAMQDFLGSGEFLASMSLLPELFVDLEGRRDHLDE